MKEHNGTIEAANAPGGGAVFTVTLRAASPVN
jgi:signal transduction histidine kinase